MAQKNFQLHPWLAKIFVKNRKMFFCKLHSLILGTPFDGSLLFFQHVLFVGSLIYSYRTYQKTQTVSLNCGGTPSIGQINIIVATLKKNDITQANRRKKLSKNGFHTGTMFHRPLTISSSLKITAA